MRKGYQRNSRYANLIRICAPRFPISELRKFGAMRRHHYHSHQITTLYVFNIDVTLQIFNFRFRKFNATFSFRCDILVSWVDQTVNMCNKTDLWITETFLVQKRGLDTHIRCDKNEESESDKDATGCSNEDENPQNLLGNNELIMSSLVHDQLRNKNGKGMWDSCSDQHGEFTQNRQKNDII